MDDDKNLVILCATFLAAMSMWLMGAEAMTIVSNVVTGLFGVAVGKSMNGNRVG